MDPKQKKRLDILLKARKRAEKVLAERREAEQKKRDHQMRKEANQELMKRYTMELNAIAQESGILALAEQAAQERGGHLAQQVSYYVDYGPSTSILHLSLVTEVQGELRASYLSLRIIWGQPEALQEVEVRVYPNGQITYHNCILPVFPFLWRRYPQLLPKMLKRALEHPRPAPSPEKKKTDLL